MTAKTPKQCGHSHQHSPTKQINTISNQVSKSTPNPNKKTAEEPAYLTRCPHVCLIANFHVEDLNSEDLLKLKYETKRLAITSSVTGVETAVEQMDYSENNNSLVCDECEQTKNLWLCLREGCLYVGCGGNSKDDNSYKHSTTHAQVVEISNAKSDR